MRSFLLILPILLFCFAAEISASEQYPYSASVAVAETFVRSGPGTEYYPTSPLRIGDKVEVYYETEDWCAIRPPIGSFSWISARYVELGTNNIGKVIADGLASRVGCENTELCDTVQVKLKKGEKVLILDRCETPENAASPLWFKIAPPSGEFRWIPRADLMPGAAVQASGLTQKKLSPKQSVVQVVYAAEEETVKSDPIVPPPTRPVRLSQASAPNEPDKNEKTSKKTLADVPSLEMPSLESKLALNQPGSLQFNSVKEVAVADPIQKAFEKAFEELKEETRIALVRPTEDWVFDTLIHRGSELYEVAPTDKDLEKTYQLVETLQRTKAVRQEISMRRQFRTGQLLTPPPSATPYPANSANFLPNTRNTLAASVPASIPTAKPASFSNSGAPAPMTATASNSTASNSKIASAVNQTPTTGKTADFDIVGKLGAFDPLPKGHPPYAVVDDKDEIICLISPASGVDLKQYLGKTVGINGILGFFEKPGQPKRRHITALEAAMTEK